MFPNLARVCLLNLQCLIRVSLIWLLILTRHVCWEVCGEVWISWQTPERQVLQRDCTTSSIFLNYSRLNSQHKWRDKIWVVSAVQFRNEFDEIWAPEIWGMTIALIWICWLSVHMFELWCSRRCGCRSETDSFGPTYLTSLVYTT